MHRALGEWTGEPVYLPQLSGFSLFRWLRRSPCPCPARQTRRADSEPRFRIEHWNVFGQRA